MKKFIITLMATMLIFASSPAFSQSEEGVGKCIFKLTVDVARDFGAKVSDKKVYQYQKDYPKHHSTGDIYLVAAGITLGLALSGVGIGLIPVAIPVVVAAMGIQNGYRSVKSFFKNMGNKVSSGVKNHFAVKRRNKKLIANSEMLLLLMDVFRGYGENLDNFAKSVGVSPDRARRKIKMYNVTGRLCKGANYTVKQLKLKAFNN